MDQVVGELMAVSVGEVGVLHAGSRTIRTAFVKHRVAGRVTLSRHGLPGDEHVYEHHGGPDMAALVYPFDHYPRWESELGRALTVPSFGENLTVVGPVEEDVHLGDVLTIGSAVVEVAQPRTPCYKLAAAFGVKDMAVRVQTTGRIGYLLRVLEEGTIGAGDEVRLVGRQSHGVTVAEAGRVVNIASDDLGAARKVLAVASLGSAVRRTLEARLASAEPAGLDTERLFGEDGD